LASVPLDSGRPSDPSLALGIVRVLRELEVASGFSGPSLALGIVRVLREGGIQFCWAPQVSSSCSGIAGSCPCSGSGVFPVPRWLCALSGSCVKEGVCSCWAPKSQVPARAVPGPVPVVDLFPFYGQRHSYRGESALPESARFLVDWLFIGSRRFTSPPGVKPSLVPVSPTLVRQCRLRVR
jgi:hypothetical protein